MDVKSLADHVADRFPDLVVHPAFYDDMEALFKNSGALGTFLKKLYPKLAQLSVFQHEAFQKCAGFKRLQGTALSRFTVRIKQCNGKIFYSSAGCRQIILLVFDEDEGKKNADYTSHVPIAQRRLSEIKEANPQ